MLPLYKATLFEKALGLLFQGWKLSSCEKSEISSYSVITNRECFQEEHSVEVDAHGWDAHIWYYGRTNAEERDKTAEQQVQIGEITSPTVSAMDWNLLYHKLRL